jgi:hypothetical protein
LSSRAICSSNFVLSRHASHSWAKPAVIFISMPIAIDPPEP